ncbi:pilus assembly protein CpaE [Nocardioides scoriae]|uniref:Pilus assembly protein CpaE n=1 Tax=Nocardioides scoriae TaxID=642780 RepID=A0A1H1MKL9_9ACTN|nr:AAA family ATPase [Nocardioides scoriae]SDR87391.1 pilus assembly protein CpaE [Nocardioides scoriae]
MPLLLEADTTVAGVMATTLGNGSKVVSRAEDVDTQLERRGEYAVVLGPSVDLPLAAATAERVRRTHPATTVILVRHHIEPELYARALEAGIGAVVSADDQPGIAGAIARAKQSWETLHGGSSGDGDRDGRVVTVFSPKGGVGKTTMTVNLALALTALGSRVCVIDLDLAFGDVAITLQLIPPHTIADAAGFEDSLDWSLLEGLLTPHPSGMSILAAPTQPEGRDRITPTLVRRIISTLRRRFDHVLIDTPPGFDDQVLGAFDETDECVIVVTLDVPTVKNAKVALETLDLLRLVRDRRHLVLNRADGEVGLTGAQVEDILGMEVSLTLPSATAVASATNHGDPIVASRPDHAVSQAITGFVASTLEGVGSLEQPGATVKRGLFGRRRKDAR